MCSKFRRVRGDYVSQVELSQNVTLLKEKLDGGKTIIHTAQVDADNTDELIELNQWLWARCSD